MYKHNSSSILIIERSIKGKWMGRSLKIAFYTDSFLPAVDGVVVSSSTSGRACKGKGTRCTYSQEEIPNQRSLQNPTRTYT